MAHRMIPNRWIALSDDSTTQLIYVPGVDPAPLLVSEPAQAPLLASLMVVITNNTGVTVTIDSITFTIPVGTSGGSLTPSISGVTTPVSDTKLWTFIGPASNSPSDSATFTLAPAANQTGALAPTTSITVQISGFPTNQVPGTASVSIVETLQGDSTPGTSSFLVTTFPFGFFFDGLAVLSGGGTTQTPVAEVASGTAITLVWNSSVAATESFSIYYSGSDTASQPTAPGELYLPNGVERDTVFVVVLNTQVPGDQPVQASLSTAITISDPTLESLSVSGTLNVGGNSTLENVTVDGTLTLNTPLSVDSLIVGGLIVTPGGEALLAGTVSAFGSPQTLTLGAWYYNVATTTSMASATYTATSDGLVIGVVCWPGTPGNSMGWISAQNNSTGMSAYAMGGTTIAYVNISENSAIGVANNQTFTLPVGVGQTFTIWATLPTSIPNYNTPAMSFSFVPIGQNGTANLSSDSSAAATPKQYAGQYAWRMALDELQPGSTEPGPSAGKRASTEHDPGHESEPPHDGQQNRRK